MHITKAFQHWSSASCHWSIIGHCVPSGRDGTWRDPAWLVEFSAPVPRSSLARGRTWTTQSSAWNSPARCLQLTRRRSHWAVCFQSIAAWEPLVLRQGYHDIGERLQDWRREFRGLIVYRKHMQSIGCDVRYEMIIDEHCHWCTYKTPAWPLRPLVSPKKRSFKR